MEPNTRINDDNQKEDKEESEILKLPKGQAILFEILLIIHLIVLIAMLLFFGLNHLISFVAATTITVRMLLGVKFNKPNYYNKGLFFFIWCFAFYLIKIIFRFILTFFTFKLRDDVDNLTDMNIIETKNILWIKKFDISLNGLWAIIILSVFMIFWLILIILFTKKQYYFNYADNSNDSQYITLIKEFYERKNVANNEGIELQN